MTYSLPSGSHSADEVWTQLVSLGDASHTSNWNLLWERSEQGKCVQRFPRNISWKWSLGASCTFYSLNLLLEFRNFVSTQRNFMDKL